MLGPTGSMIEAHGLEFAYGNVQVLFGVDMKVDVGEMVALLGTNGAGKSTLLNLLAGLAPPSGGTIALDGEDVTGVDAAAMVRRGVVLVQGGKAVFPDLTVEENLEVGLHSKRLKGEAARRRATEGLERFPELLQLSARWAGTLSGGEQQQLAIAKGLLTEPRLLMIDELSLGLAPQTKDEMIALVRQVHAAGTTVVLVEQSLEVAALLTDRAVFLEKGEVRFDGATAELVGRGDLARAVFLGALPR
jgi:ABC-type branched-subunit amino acid transport system ATPase component